MSFNTGNIANVWSSALAPKKTENHKCDIIRIKGDTVNLCTLKTVMFANNEYTIYVVLHCVIHKGMLKYFHLIFISTV